jgi:hypothetical protein
MKLEITMAELLKDMKEYTDWVQYLAFFRQYCIETYDVDPDDDFGLNYEYTKKFGKQPPEVLEQWN